MARIRKGSRIATYLVGNLDIAKDDKADSQHLLPHGEKKRKKSKVLSFIVMVDDVEIMADKTQNNGSTPVPAPKANPVKTSVLLDVKPRDNETDMNAMLKIIKSILKDGLVRGASKIAPPVGHGHVCEGYAFFINNCNSTEIKSSC
jgi:hypothetical protein